MTRRIIAIHALVFICIAFLFVPVFFVSAQEDPGRIVPMCSGDSCNFCHLAQLINNVIKFGVYISVFVAVAMFVYAGGLYVLNNGNPEKIKKANGIFLQVLIGIIIILGAWLAVDTMMKALVGDPNAKFGVWNAVCDSSSASSALPGGQNINTQFGSQ